MASGRRIKTLQKMIRRAHPSEDGSVLLMALGLIVLLFVVITAIFYFALSTQKMIVQRLWGYFGSHFLEYMTQIII